MFDALYQEDADRALSLEAANPKPLPKRPEPGFFSGVGSALVRGPAQGATESGRAAALLLDPFAKAAGFAAGAPRSESIDRMFEGRESETVRELGRAREKYSLDPETAGAAAQIIHGAAKMITKGAGYALTMGPVAGPVGFGVDEGITEGLNLTDRGVGLKTAAQVGLVRGVTSAVQLALPIAGQTWRQTAGLVATAGPLPIFAERQASQALLEAAGYDDIAKEYDPYDLTMLLVGTLGPAAFGAGAMGLRAFRAGRLDAKTPTKEVGREPVSEVRVEPTMADGEAPAVRMEGEGQVEPTLRADAAPPEAVDAARVHVLNEAGDAAALGSRTDPVAMREHAAAMRAAEDAIASGRPVDVTNIVRQDRVAFDALAQRLDLGPLAARADPAPIPAAVEPVASPRAPEAVAGLQDGPPVAPGEPVPVQVADQPAGASTAGEPAKAEPMVSGAEVAALSERVGRMELHTDAGDVRPAADVVAEAAEAMKAAETDAKAFRAAVECLIRVGA